MKPTPTGAPSAQGGTLAEFPPGGTRPGAAAAKAGLKAPLSTFKVNSKSSSLHMSLL